jgi:hypothetical protein
MTKVRQKIFTTVRISGRSLAYLHSRRYQRLLQITLKKR